MVTRKKRKDRQKARDVAAKRYEKHRRHNLVYAKPGPHEFIVVLDNLKPSFNIGKIFRTADAFGAHEIHLVGTDYFDTNSAMGSFKWVPARFQPDFATSYNDLTERGYTLFMLEPEEGNYLHLAKMPAKSAFVFGHEEFGFSFDRKDYPGIKTLSIKQLGKVQSLNVSVAASIVMYEYFRLHETISPSQPAAVKRQRNLRDERN